MGSIGQKIRTGGPSIRAGSSSGGQEHQVVWDNGLRDGVAYGACRPWLPLHSLKELLTLFAGTDRNARAARSCALSTKFLPFLLTISRTLFINNSGILFETQTLSGRDKATRNQRSAKRAACPVNCGTT
jgi:hypothetical protein